MPCSCAAPTVEIEGAETCTSCGLERARTFCDATVPIAANGTNGANAANGASGAKNRALAEAEKAPVPYKRRLVAYRQYVGTLALHEAVAADAVRVFEERVLRRASVMRGLRAAAVRLACVVVASAALCSAAVKDSVVRSDEAACAQYGYQRLRGAVDRALDSLLGARSCFVGTGDFGVQVDAYQRAVARLGAAPKYVRVCTRVDAACFTPSERARFRDGSLAASVLLAVATTRCNRAARATLGVNVLTASRVRATIEARATTNRALSRALSAA